MIELRGSDEMAAAADRPTLSVCMIVKDEEALLGQCLESITPVADELIVVDTGSTDRTVEIARQYTDRVYFHAWRDSFSEARNHALGYATCDWVLQIDADEALFQEDIRVLKAALVRAQTVPDIDVIQVPIFSELSGRRVSKHYFPRIQRRGRAHYEGIVHNQVVYDGSDMVAEIRFWHFGYNLSPQEMERKVRRTEELLLRQIEKNPDNTFAWMNLLRIYRNRREYEKVLEKGRWLLDHPSATAEHRHSAADDMLVCLVRLGRYEEGEAVALESLKENPESLDLTFDLGVLYLKSGQVDKATRRFKQFLSLKREEDRHGPQFSLLLQDHYSSETGAWNNLGQCYHMQGRLQEAAEAYKRAIQLDARQEGIYTNLAFTHLQLGEVSQAAMVLERAVGEGIAGATSWRMLADVRRIEGSSRASERCYRRAIECDPADVDAHLGLGAVLASTKRLPEAVEALGEALKLAPDCPGAWLAWVQLHHELGDREQTILGLDRLLAQGDWDGANLLSLAGVSVSVEAYEQAVGFLERHLQKHPQDVSALGDLATCYAKMRQFGAALEGYRAVLAIRPDDEAVRRNLRTLQQLLADELSSPA